MLVEWADERKAQKRETQCKTGARHLMTYWMVSAFICNDLNSFVEWLWWATALCESSSNQSVMLDVGTSPLAFNNS